MIRITTWLRIYPRLNFPYWSIINLLPLNYFQSCFDSEWDLILAFWIFWISLSVFLSLFECLWLFTTVIRRVGRENAPIQKSFYPNEGLLGRLASYPHCCLLLPHIFSHVGECLRTPCLKKDLLLYALQWLLLPPNFTAMGLYKRTIFTFSGPFMLL